MSEIKKQNENMKLETNKKEKKLKKKEEDFEKEKLSNQKKLNDEISKSKNLTQLVDDQRNLINEYKTELDTLKLNNEELNKKLEDLISEKIKDESFRNQLIKRISEEDQLKNQKFNLQLELSALKNVELMREVEKKNREIESIKSKLEYTQKRLKEREEEAEQERLEQMKLKLEEKNKKEQKEKLMKNKNIENVNKYSKIPTITRWQKLYFNHSNRRRLNKNNMCGINGTKFSHIFRSIYVISIMSIK